MKTIQVSTEPANETGIEPKESSIAHVAFVAGPDSEVNPLGTLQNQVSKLEKYDSLEHLYAEARQCRKCQLCKTRTNVVLYRGNPGAPLMIIGEGPGQQEDETGEPFVGKAGRLLDKILDSVSLDRDKDVYICNVVKCRPPGNRVPETEEMEQCRAYLEAQIDLVEPRVILLAGATAMKAVLQNKYPISKVRGRWFDFRNGARVMPIFHPSYLLRNDSKEKGSPKWLMWQDIKNVKQELDRLRSSPQ